MNALILFAHGSRDPAWRQPFEAMLARLRAASPDTPAALAYLELMEPDFASVCAELVAAGATHIRVLPVFLAAGKHLRVDLPELVDAATAAHKRKSLSFTVLPPVGEHASLQATVVELALRS